jgi:protease I
MPELRGCRVAILVDDGFEQVELLEPRRALDDAGADTRVVSPKADRVRGWNFREWGDTVAVDVPLDRGRRIAPWPADRAVAVAQDRPAQRRRRMVDREVVVDGNLVSSRKPDDIPAFNRAMIELFRGARAEAQVSV